MARRDLLLEICRCPNVSAARRDNDHPCAEVVRSQDVRTLNDFQVASPWVGRIHRAPILFVSSNPSISATEQHPTWRKSDDFRIDYFENHFGRGQKEWTRDGVRTLQRDGSYSRPVRFFSGIKRHAEEILGRAARPGTDYALTYVVRCKSRDEVGVRGAAFECSSLYLKRTIIAAKARLIVVLGNRAHDAVSREFGVVADRNHISRPMRVGRRDRCFVYLAHPSARGKAGRPRRLTPHEIARLQPHLA